MARAIFLSDCHLAEPSDDNYRRMLSFLDGVGPLSDLFILGDFFDCWMGFSNAPERYLPLTDRISSLVRGGTRLHYVEGNHDIDVAPFFAKKLGATVYPECGEVNLGGKRLYLAHGDLSDPSDTGYLRLRRLLRSPPLRLLSHILPGSAVLALWAPFIGGKAERIYANSRLPGLMRDLARQKWAAGYDGVVMGHCHHPEFLEGEGADDGRFYANLGDWVRHFTYLEFDGDGFRLRTAD
ncbi:MAG: UDP-2,3-diacylglucosamine diphosphatase [Leptospirillia bacterium]